MTFFLVLITRKNILTCKTQMNLYHGFGNFLANPPAPGWPWVALDCGLIGILCTLNGHRFFLGQFIVIVIRRNISKKPSEKDKWLPQNVNRLMSLLNLYFRFCEYYYWQPLTVTFTAGAAEANVPTLPICSFHFKFKSCSFHLLFLLFPFQVKNSLDILT